MNDRAIRPMSNALISSLSQEACEFLHAGSRQVKLPKGYVLTHRSTHPGQAFFVLQGLASLIVSMPEGTHTDVGMIGAEGVIGAGALMGSVRRVADSVIRVQSIALVVPIGRLQIAFERFIDFRLRFLEFVQAFTLTTQLAASCNRTHDAKARLARCLLMAGSRAGSYTLPFTHEFLAEMLGVRRTTVSLALKELQQQSVVTYQRGSIVINKPEEMRGIACECYPIVDKLHRQLYSRSLPCA